MIPRLIIVIYLCLATGASAQTLLGVTYPPHSGGKSSSGGVTSYVGPTDIVGNAAYFYSLRAASASAAGNAAVNVCSIGDGACADFLTSKTTGSLVVPATLNSQPCNVAITSGTYVSATGAISLITAAGSNLASGNFFALSALTGTGSVTGLDLYLTAATGTTGTTVNATGPTGLGTIAITGGTVSVCTIKTWYDQSGNSRNATQGTIADRAILTVSCLNTSLPCATAPGISAQGYTATAVNIPVPLSMTGVAERQLNSTGDGALIGGDNGTTTFNALLFESSTAFWGIDSASGTVDLGSVASGVWHAAQGLVCASGACSNMIVDNNIGNAGNYGTTGILSSDTIHILNDGYGDFVKGAITEVGIWPVVFTYLQASNLCANQFAYWGTSQACGINGPSAQWGYSTLALSDPMSSLSTIDLSNTETAGFNWYIKNSFENVQLFSCSGTVYNFCYLLPTWVSTSSDYSLAGGGVQLSGVSATQDGLESCVWNVGTSSLIGKSYTGGIYLDAQMAFQAGSNFNSIWFLPQEFLNGTITNTNFPEIDLFEHGLTAGTNHDWNEGASTEVNNYLSTLTTTAFGNINYSLMHHYGMLWVPASRNGGTGILQYFIDGLLFKTQNYSSGAVPSPALGPANPSGALFELDSEHLCPIIYGSGNGDTTTVGPIKIWQHP